MVDKANGTSVRSMRNASYDIVMAGGYFVTGFGPTYWGGYRDPGVLPRRRIPREEVNG